MKYDARYSEPAMTNQVGGQESHQSRLISAVAAVRQSAALARDILDALVGAPSQLSPKAETAPGQPCLSAVLDGVPSDIHEACSKLNESLNEIRATLRI